MRSQNEMKHGLAKKIFLYSIMMTLLFTGYESYRDTVMKAKERIQSGFYTIFTSVKAKLQNTVAQNDHQKSSSDNHWPVVGWPVEKLSTASEVKYLSSLEKDIILHLNMARSNPRRYAEEFIVPRVQYYRGKTYREPWESSNFRGYVKQEGVEAVHECAGVMERTSPIALLHPSEGITLAARDHAIDKSHNRDTGHFGTDGSNPSKRLNRYGKWQSVMGESISYGPVSGREIVVSLLVDDGTQGREHRDNILNSQFKVVGVSIKKHPVYEYICVIDFAGAYREKQHMRKTSGTGHE